MYQANIRQRNTNEQLVSNRIKQVKTYLIGLLSIIGIVSTYIGGHVLSAVEFLTLLAGVLLTFIIMYTFSVLSSIIIASTIIFGLSLFVVTYALLHQNVNQVQLITHQLLFATIFLSWWLIIALIYTEEENLIKLKAMLNQLRKIDPVSGVLTFNEFISEMFLVTKAIARRNEPASFIFIKIKTPLGKEPKTLLRIIGNTILDSIRRGYDIVGKTGNNTFVIMLQGTDTDKANIVINRILQKLEKHPRISGEELRKYMEIYTLPATENPETNEQIIRDHTQ